MPWYEYETFEKWYKSKLNGRDGIGVIVARTLHNGKKRTIEAFTHGNTSALFEMKFLYRMGPVFRASL